MRLTTRLLLAILATLTLVLAACGDDDAASTATESGQAATSSEADTQPDTGDTADTGDTGAAPDESSAQTEADLPMVVVTTNILGDVVERLAGGEVETIVVMPVGSDPHDFQASAQQVDQMQNADALIVNGSALEEGLLDIIDAAESDGVATHEAIGPVATIDFGAGGHDHGDDEHGDDEHGDDEHGDDEHDHAHEGDDPHFFTDPARMAVAVEGITDFLVATVDGVDAEALEANAAAYIAELEALDAEVEEILAVVPEDRRLLVTNHDAFGYFADRYDFEVLGSIIPGGSTLASASARDLAELASTIDELDVPAVFAETITSSQLAETLGGESDVEIVELFSGSLGAPDSGAGTYIEMVRTNAERIAAALA